jgi:aspartate/methionine/tyrosine aminotransferase
MEESNNNSIKPSNRATTVESFKVMDVLRRANQLEAEGRTIYHCEVGQPESGAPKTVAQAAVAALTGDADQSRLGYTDAFGLLALREKIAEHYKEKYALPTDKEVGTDRIVVTTGSSGGFLLAFTACFDAGDVIAIASSGYPCYRNILQALGCELANVSINEEFKLTANELRQEIEQRQASGKKKLKGLILSSPSNPTGAMLSVQEVKDMCELCEKEGIRFLSDEIYHGISYGKEAATALSFSSTAIVINSFSKYYSMSGWRLGWMVLPADLVDPINTLQQNMFINAPTISQTAAIQCWEPETIAELETHVAKYRTSREFILKQMETISEIPPKNIAPADGGFYVYVDLGEELVCRERGLGSTEMCRMLLEDKGVAFTPGTDFEDPAGSLGDRRFRISYAGGTTVVADAMTHFKEFWPFWVKMVNDAKN